MSVTLESSLAIRPSLRACHAEGRGARWLSRAVMGRAARRSPPSTATTKSFLRTGGGNTCLPPHIYDTRENKDSPVGPSRRPTSRVHLVGFVLVVAGRVGYRVSTYGRLVIRIA